MRAVLGLGIVLAALSLLPGVARGQEEPWRLVQASDGILYLVAGEVRHRIVPAVMPDDALAAIPEAEPYEDGVVARPAPAPAAEPTPVPGWQQIARWEVKGDRRTEPFTVGGSSWRITYAAKNPDRHTSICLEVYRLGNARPIQDGCARGDDTTYVYGGPGTYYLDIERIGEWTVTVEDNR